MTSKELRIGNIVLARGAQSVVKSIDENHIGYSKSKKGEERIPIKLIQPIPLTEEWLVKFGFEETEKRTWEISQIVYDIDFCVHVDDGKVTVILWQSDPVYIKNIKHVHQLQNLYFALTGEELTIKK